MGVSGELHDLAPTYPGEMTPGTHCRKLKMYENVLADKDIKFILSFVKIGQLVRMLKGELPHRERTVILPAYFPFR
jgi:hypothetical protein